LLSVNEDTGKYVKAILLNQEQLFGKQICAAEKEDTIGETIKVMNEGGMDFAFEQYSMEQYQKALAEKGLPDLFIEDMTENMSFVEEFGFFGDMARSPTYLQQNTMNDNELDDTNTEYYSQDRQECRKVEIIM
jgi:hypothetical protein